MKKNHITFVAYDTLCSVTIFGEDTPLIRQLLEQSQELALQVQSTLSMYDPDSELSTLCRTYRPDVPAPVSPMLMDFLHWNQVFFRQTAGAFDPTVGALVRLWDFLADDPQVPSEEEIARHLSSVGFQHVHLEEASGTVCFDAPHISLDPGASGKGYALKLVAEHLRKAGISHAVLDFGGNMYVIGGKPQPDGPDVPWKIALRDPDATDTYIGTVTMQDCGIATSSWYEHSFQKDHILYHHLLDPRTGYPKPLELKSVSVLSSDGAFTDFLSTSLFILGEAEGIRLIERLQSLYPETIEYVLVRRDRSVCCSHGVFTPRPGTDS